MPHTICYAVKANWNLAILRLLARAGAGFDIVSGGELFRVLKAGGDPRKVVFSGVGKTADEIDYALREGIFSFNCESEPELALIDALAHRRGVKARVAFRVNPDVEAVHPPLHFDRPARSTNSASISRKPKASTSARRAHAGTCRSKA